MIKHEIKKITRYEYWHVWGFYAPFVPVYLYFSLLNRSLLYFCRVNPGMKYGGFFDYSKHKIQKQVPKEFRPKDCLISPGENPEKPFDYPFILKPNQSERGRNVQFVKNEKAYRLYLEKHKEEQVIAQEIIDYPLEFGVFYAKLPQEEKGRILSITGKEFLSLKGDGKTSLRMFIESNERAYFQKSYLYMKYHNRMEEILPEGEVWVLEKIGNHNRGTYFYDSFLLKTKELEEAVNAVALNLKNFYYGRFDVKAKSIEDFKKGHFKVIEVNGVNSEPTHIYDLKYSIVKAYKEVFRHLNIQQKIAQQQRGKGVRTPRMKTFVKDLVQHLNK